MKLLWQQISSTIISEIYADSDYDGIVLDTEHGAFNNENLYTSIQIITLRRKNCFVRVSHLDKALVRMCLDAGATGIIFSTVENENQAQEIIDYCKYPKHGGKRGQGLVRENFWGKDKLQNIMPIVIAQIETKEAVDNLEELYNMPFDYYLVGPYDLSASLGCVGEWDNKEYKEYLEKINMIPKELRGVHLVKTEDIKSHDLDGYGFYALGMDTTMLIDAIKKLDK
tara:strand:+ start:196 stop:873 length:678 start_codon:yes stop_codon:yes gene_type:complete